MEYILIMLLFVLAFIVMAVKAANALFWIILGGTVIAWLLSLLFEVTKQYDAFKFCYNLFFTGRIISVAMCIILLLIRWLMPWMLM